MIYFVKQNQNIKNIFEMVIQILVSAESNYNKIIICGNIINRTLSNIRLIELYHRLLYYHVEYL